MSEIINTYLLDDPKTCLPMDRDNFYKEQIKTFKKKLGNQLELMKLLIYFYSIQEKNLLSKRDLITKNITQIF